MIPLLVVLLIIVIIGLIRVGAFVIYSEDGFFAWLRIAFVSVKLYPREAKPTKEKPVKPSEPKDLEKKKRGGDFETFKTYFALGKDALSDFIGTVKLRWLRLDFVAAARDDPAKAAVLYGSAWSAAGIIIPQLENNNSVSKYAYSIELDFSIQRPTIYLEADAAVTIWRAVSILIKHGVRFLKASNRIKKGRLKHG